MEGQNFGSILKKYGLDFLKIQKPFLEKEWHPLFEDKSAAWELYIEILTRVTVHPIPHQEGDEITALQSLHEIFVLSRAIMRGGGSKCMEFSKMTLAFLNQVLRPFTTKWHGLSLGGGFKEIEKCHQFRKELGELHLKVLPFCKFLAGLAGVEDLTEFEAKT